MGLLCEGEESARNNMEYVTLPGTDLKVSRICVGTMQFAGSVESGTTDVTWGQIDQDTVNATVRRAIAAGVNFFDGTPLTEHARVFLSLFVHQVQRPMERTTRPVQPARAACHLTGVHNAGGEGTRRGST